jgi:hypothetical protein
MRAGVRAYEPDISEILAADVFGDLAALIGENAGLVPSTMSPMGHAEAAFRNARDAWYEAITAEDSQFAPEESDWAEDAEALALERIVPPVTQEVIPWLLMYRDPYSRPPVHEWCDRCEALFVGGDQPLLTPRGEKLCAQCYEE